MFNDLDISPSTVHNIIKRFKESGGISVRKGQGRKPKLNNRDLRSLRRHCIKNRHSSRSDITTWAQDYFGKPLSITTIRSYIHKCQLKLSCAKRKPYVNRVQKRRRLIWARRHLGWTITVETCTVVRWISISGIFGRNGRRVLRTKEEKDHPDCYQQQVQKPGSVMVWGCVSALGKGNLHFCDGTINAEKIHRDFGAQYAAFKKTSFPGTSMHISTRQCKTTFCTHNKVLAAEEEGTSTWLACLQSRPVSNRECVAHFEAQNATTKTPYCCPP